MTDKPKLCAECAAALRELIENHERELAAYTDLFAPDSMIHFEIRARIYGHFFKRVKDMIGETKQ